MKLVREYINEVKLTDIIRPLSDKQILDDIKHMSQEEKTKNYGLHLEQEILRWQRYCFGLEQM